MKKEKKKKTVTGDIIKGLCNFFFRRLIQLIRRDMCIAQALFSWDSNLIFPKYVFGKSYLPLEPKQLG